MTESEFIKFYKKRNFSRSKKEAKEKIDLFWTVLLTALEENKKVVFKGWGSFERKEVKSRKILVPMWKEAAYTKPKKVIKFRPGLDLLKVINENRDENG